MVNILKNEQRIVAPGVKAAFTTLIDRAAVEGLVADDLTGLMMGVRFYREGKYVFAFQTNPHHLNFYIRKPAATRWGSLRDQANAHFNVAREANGEVQIHLRTQDEAQRLANWLFRLP